MAKKKGLKPVVDNPLLKKNVVLDSPSKESEVLEALQELFKNFSSPRISDAEALRSLTDNEKDELKGLKGKKLRERLKPIKAKLYEEKNSGRQQVPKEIRFGLRQCLKDIERDGLSYVLYDTSVNLPAIKTILDRKNLVKIGIPSLSMTVRNHLGFKCLLVGFSSIPVQHLESFLTLLESKFPSQKEDREKVILKRKELSSEILADEPSPAPKKHVPGDNFIAFTDTKARKNLPYQPTLMKLIKKFPSFAQQNQV